MEKHITEEEYKVLLAYRKASNETQGCIKRILGVEPIQEAAGPEKKPAQIIEFKRYRA